MATIAVFVSLFAHACLFACIALLAAWIAAMVVAALRAESRLPGRVPLTTRLQVATFGALTLTCLLLLAVGSRMQARWTFFMLLALPLVGVNLWASVRLLLRERSARGDWPSILPGK